MEENIISSNKRIAKNTLYLYARMFFITIITLYTSRITLKVLGFEDYGIYTVVGGFLSMFASVISMMVGATQRYITFELGRKNMERLRIVFSTAVYLHIIIALFFLIAAETLGMWYLQNKMIIPVGKEGVTMIVFQLSILSMIINITQVPYNAMIIAFEKMSIYAYISILEVLLKVILTALLLYFSNTNTLILYSVFMLLVAGIVRMVYYIYVRRTIKESKLYKFFDWALIKEMSKFAGWSLLGTVSYLSINQAIPVLLNRFFGVIINTAMGIANQVSGTVNGFVYNFQMAFKPQIVKLYSRQNYIEMAKLVVRASKFSFVIMLIVSFPILMTIEYLLNIWLGQVPENTSTFCKLILIYCLIDTLTIPIWTSIEATGNIKLYQLVVGIFFICYIPLSYIMLKSGFSAKDILMLKILMSVIIHTIRVYIMKKMIPQINVFMYFRQVISPIVVASSLLICIGLIISPETRTISFIEFLCFFLCCFLIALVISYVIILNNNERKMIYSIIKDKVRNGKNK